MAGRGDTVQDELTFLEEEIAMLERRLTSMDEDEMARDMPHLYHNSGIKRHTKRRMNRNSSARMSPDRYSTPEPNAYLPRDRYVTSRDKQPNTSTPKVILPSSEQESIEENDSHNKPRGFKFKAATYDGSSSWLDYKAHFDVCADLNGWTYKEKGQYLAVSLRGQAQGIFGNLGAKCSDFNELSKALEDRFSPANQTELYRVQLRERKQKASESLPELAQDIRRLTNQAYATAPADVKETLAKEQFIDALRVSDMRIRVKQARPRNLNDAVQHAVELDAYIRAERQHQEGQGFLAQTTHGAESGKQSEISKLQKDVTILQETVSKLTKKIDDMLSIQRNSSVNNQPHSRNKPQKVEASEHEHKLKRKCYLCGSEKHLRPDCPDLKTKGTSTNHVNGTNQSNSVLGLSTGLYINCKVNSVPIYCLIDTGASLTIISSRMADMINGSGDLPLKSFNTKVFSVSGDQINVKGRMDVLIEIETVKRVTSVVVADIEGDMTLGLDFLTANKCHIDLVQKTIELKGVPIQLRIEGKIGCLRTVASDNIKVTLPRHTKGLSENKVRKFRSSDGKSSRKGNRTESENDHVSYAPGQGNKRRKKPVLVNAAVTTNCDVNLTKTQRPNKRSAQRIECHVCEKKFGRRQYMLKHLKRVHHSRSTMVADARSITSVDSGQSVRNGRPRMELQRKASIESRQILYARTLYSEAWVM